MLEAVQVEEDQDVVHVRPHEQLLEIVEETAPVAEAGQRVGARLRARRSDHRHVLGERDRHAHDHAKERRGASTSASGLIRSKWS